MRELDEAFLAYFPESQKDIKDISNKALVPIFTGRKKDLGNWMYTVLYSMLLELARGSKHPNLHIFETAVDCWPTLALDSAPSHTSLVRKGDIIEIAIVLSKQAIGKKRPTQWYYLMGEFYSIMLSIIKILSTSTAGDPSKRHNPQPSFFSRLLLYTYFLEHCDHEPIRQQCMRKASAEVKKLVEHRLSE